MEKVISIIIPTYNMEQYIRRAMESLLLKRNLDAIDVLVINDGSKDRSSEIAHEFADQYPQSFRVVDKSNGNYGSCINEGLKHAVGKYVKIMDADDYFDTDNFEEMVETLKQVDTDLVITHFAMVDADGKRGEVRHLHIPSGKTLAIADIAQKKSIQGLWMHEIAYRRENVVKMNYHQREGISYTDVQWGFEPMATVKTAYYIDRLVYLYFVGREGQSMDMDVYKKRFNHEFECSSAMLDGLVGRTIADKVVKRMMEEKMKGRILALYKRALVHFDDCENVPMIAFDEELKAKAPELYRAVGRKLLSTPLFCIPYVALWRRNRHGALLTLVLRLYRKYKHL